MADSIHIQVCLRPWLGLWSTRPAALFNLEVWAFFFSQAPLYGRVVINEIGSWKTVSVLRKKKQSKNTACGPIGPESPGGWEQLAASGLSQPLGFCLCSHSSGIMKSKPSACKLLGPRWGPGQRRGPNIPCWQEGSP